MEAPTFFFPVEVFPTEDKDAAFVERFLFFDAPPRIDNIMDDSFNDPIYRDCLLGLEICDVP
jgi:hypothetical protein